ncbi:RDD family protein [Reinekea blandensis]|uniref:RDD family protein n=1 Tax=Reinekea blandensis TaxID=374838 RepID=UPI0002EAE3BF|nr:RDD family protein [Reinekea blandensis]
MNPTYRAHTLRAVGAVIYDGLIMLGLLMIAGALALPVNRLLTGDASDGSHPLFQIYLLLVLSGYYLYFWKRSGQTVGMKAWRLKLVAQSDEPMTIRQLLIRQVTAIPAYLLIVGVFWQYWDKDELNWQDRASGTRLIYLGKKK